MPLLLGLFLGLFIGLGLPHFVVGFVIKRRIGKFTAKFPDAIELLVRGLRSGLPISETMTVVGNEVEGPVGEEFRAVSDKMKIGRTRPEEHTFELQSLMRNSYHVFCLKNKKKHKH